MTDYTDLPGKLAMLLARCHFVPTRRRLMRLLLIVPIILISSAIFLHIVGIQSAINNDMGRTDQSAYMDASIRAYETQFTYTGDRNRMPMYTFIQALFYDPEMTDEEFFQHGKRLNVAIAVVCIAILGAVFFSRFSTLYATYSMLLIALIVFAMKAPYFQTELLFYTLFALAFILALDCIRKPNIWKSIAVGALFALSQYTKASAMPGLFIFAGSYGILALCKLLNRSLNRKSLLNILYYAVVPIIAYIAVMFPYMNESKQVFGSYTYNVNTTFYIWYETWSEAKAGTRQAGDRVGWPDLPDEEIPSIAKYLNEHSLKEILVRFSNGASFLLKLACHNEGIDILAYGYCGQMGLSLLMAFVGATIFLRNSRYSSQMMHMVFFTISFLLLYFLAFSWYTGILRGTRTVLSLLIPALWTVGLIVHDPRIQRLTLTVLRRQIKVFDAAYVIILLTLLLEIYRLASYGAAELWGGS